MSITHTQIKEVAHKKWKRPRYFAMDWPDIPSGPCHNCSKRVKDSQNWRFVCSHFQIIAWPAKILVVSAKTECN
jgi:hypothetical protein